MKFSWKISSETEYYWREEDGLIVGMCHRITHTDVWVVKIIKGNEEFVLGRYIDQTSARGAIESYWTMESRTLLEEF